MRKIASGIASFLQTPFGIVIVIAVVWLFLLRQMNIQINYFVNGAIFLFDLLVAYILLDRLVYFFSQFVLPIQNQKDRAEIYSRVKVFERGERGPTLFVKNGRVIKHEGEGDKRGPGVIVLDTASAVVLRTDTKITDTVGPGIKFTEEDEYVKGSIDLRAQWQFIGPLMSEQPFLNPMPNNPKNYNELQSRRQQTAGSTRDGFEVSPSISIKFRVKRPARNRPTESGVTSQYGYDPLSVRNAITREVIQLGTARNRGTPLEWNKLPEHLVVNVWREYIRKFKLEDLFATKEDSGELKLSGLQFIEAMINKRLRQEHVEGLDDTGSKTGEWLDSQEYIQLRDRGLEIMEVRIHNVLFEQSIEEKRIKDWSAEWMKIAKKEEGLLKEQEALTETAARKEAGKRFAMAASSRFDNPIVPPQDAFSTLKKMIEPLRDAILIENRASSEMEIELRKLDEILKWVLVHSADQASKREEKG
jgi:hypothetical protein